MMSPRRQRRRVGGHASNRGANGWRNDHGTTPVDAGDPGRLFPRAEAKTLNRRITHGAIGRHSRRATSAEREPLERLVATRSKALSQLLQLAAEHAEITAERLLEALEIA